MVNNVLKDKYLTIDTLKALPKDKLTEYCLIDGDAKDWSVDINAEIEDKEMYKNLRSLFGRTLDYMAQKIFNTCSPWLPENKKLNPKLLFTLQSILEKDKVNLMTVATTGKANKYILDSTLELTALVGKAFENTLSNENNI